ncbi:MAG: hypothetical protein U0350_46180 [Caldilineaceae bacterium]
MGVRRGEAGAGLDSFAKRRLRLPRPYPTVCTHIGTHPTTRRQW